MTTKKPKVNISAGAMIVVEVDGAQKRYDCTGATRGNETPKQVIKRIQDCVGASIAKATKPKKK